MVTPVLPDHVSGTNPLLCAHPDLEARQELEELHASMVYRGKRLTKQEVRSVPFLWASLGANLAAQPWEPVAPVSDG